ncbi:MAG: polyprenyl synthetase family protein [Rickettsiaceae bacterium]|nr:MAG: polyprenyl synthetase family protein [Rickettsiaceae bacterium]
MNLIEDIHKRLAEDISAMNEIIFTHLVAKEYLITLVSNHLLKGKGKRIRPILTILTSKMFGYEGVDHIKLASAVEFIHTATLLHDDVVDGSELRRFRPTANTIWGNKASILVGDFLFSQSFKLMVSANSLSALNSLSRASAIIAEGEIAQLAKLNQKRIINIIEYEQIVTAKTAELLGAACEVGAIIAGEDENTCQKLRKFGIELGKIFQVVDDLLDYTSKDGNTGKNIGDDFLEGKVTIPLIILQQKLAQQDRVKIEDMISNETRSSSDLEWVINQINSYNVVQEVKEYVALLKVRAVEALSTELPENEFKQYLISMVNYVIERSC